MGLRGRSARRPDEPDLGHTSEGRTMSASRSAAPVRPRALAALAAAALAATGFAASATSGPPPPRRRP